MDFLDPKKKRSNRIKLFIGYALVAIAIYIATLILVLATSGYGFDRNKRAVIQNGLVFVSAHPESAQMLINGVSKGNTDGRFVLEEGKYTLELKRSGYRDWKREFSLEGGSVERFIYPFLFPQRLVSKDLQTYNVTPDLAVSSPDRHWIITHLPDAFNSFQVIDANAKDNTLTNIAVPATILSAKPGAQRLEAVEWSTDNRHLLLKHVFEGGMDYIMLDRENPGASVNITDMFGRSFAQVTLHDKRSDKLYVQETNGLLQTADVKTKATEPVAQHVAAFFPYGDNMLLYVVKESDTSDKMLAKIADGSNTYTLRALPASPSYLLNMAEFDHELYAVVGTSADSRVYLYQDPIGLIKKGGSLALPVKALLKVDAGGEYVSFSGNARIVALQGGGKFAVYDLENNRQFRYDTGLTVPEHTKATWMDGHRLNLVAQNKLNVFDFDGTNRQELNATQAGAVAMFDRDYIAMFTLSPSLTQSDRSALVRTELIAK